MNGKFELNMMAKTDINFYRWKFTSALEVPAYSDNEDDLLSLYLKNYISR